MIKRIRILPLMDEKWETEWIFPPFCAISCRTIDGEGAEKQLEAERKNVVPVLDSVIQ